MNRDNLVPIGLVGAATLLVLSWAVPSPFHEVQPAQMSRTTDLYSPPSLEAIEPSLGGDWALRTDPIDNVTVGSIRLNNSGSTGKGLSARVVAESKQFASISAELNARIVSMAFDEGERFNAGDPLVQFDCARINADYAASHANYKLHQNTLETNRELERLGSAGTHEVRQAKFEAEKAAADLNSIAAQQSMCVIKAPFDGIVSERLMNAHEVASPNQPLIRIVGYGELELNLIVPSNWLAWIRQGEQFSITLDENQQTYAAQITSVGGAVDPVSQTVRVSGKITSRQYDVTPGMSGTAYFPNAIRGRS